MSPSGKFEMGTASLEQLSELVAQQELMKTLFLHKDGPRTEYEYRMAFYKTGRLL